MLVIGERMFALRPTDHTILDLLRDRTAQACNLPTGRIFYFAIPIPKEALHAISSDSLRQLHCHVEGNRNLLHRILGYENSRSVADALTNIEEELLARENADAKPIRMPTCIGDFIEEELVGTDVYDNLAVWINNGLKSSPPFPYEDFTPEAISSIDVNLYRCDGVVVRGKLRSRTMEDPSFNHYWRKIDSLSTSEKSHYLQGVFDIMPDLENGSGWMLVPGPAHPDRIDYLAMREAMGWPDVGPPSHSVTISPSELESPHLQDAHPSMGGFRRFGNDTYESNPNYSLIDSPTMRRGSRDDMMDTRDYSQESLHSEMGYPTTVQSSDDNALQSPIPQEGHHLFDYWSDRVSLLMSFVAKIHPAEKALLDIGDLHIVKDRYSDTGYRLTTLHEPKEKILSRLEWYTILGDYNLELGIEDSDDDIFEEYLEAKSDDELPQLFWSILDMGYGPRRTIRTIPRRIRKLPGYHSYPTITTLEEFRKYFFETNSTADYSTWRGTMTDAELDEFFHTICGPHPSPRFGDYGSPGSLCDCWYGKEMSVNDDSDSEAFQDQNYDGYFKEPTPLGGTSLLKAASAHRTSDRERIQMFTDFAGCEEKFEHYLSNIGISIGDAEQHNLFGGCTSATSGMRWILSATEEDYDSSWRKMLDLKPANGIATSLYFLQQDDLLKGMSKAMLFLYCNGCVEIGSSLYGSGRRFYIEMAVSLREFNHAMNHYRRIMGIATDAYDNTEDADTYDLGNIMINPQEFLSGPELGLHLNGELEIFWDRFWWQYRLQYVDVDFDDQNTIDSNDDDRVTEESSVDDEEEEEEEDSLQTFIETLTDFELDALCNGLLKVEQDGSDLGWRLVTTYIPESPSDLLVKEDEEQGAFVSFDTFLDTLTNSDIDLMLDGKATVEPNESKNGWHLVRRDDKEGTSYVGNLSPTNPDAASNKENTDKIRTSRKATGKQPAARREYLKPSYSSCDSSLC
ncbi:hypothetical protein P280DRAFT_464860 [Massarina eburnea CBS 473.64]|uniref:Uncharacterized protein n=1 Tax=Massarina eburnea CBS 473.64 TaxID=1395130 RepID=A0A6A6SKD2_9PLEO|nr:hypothetical protein P280DRAFT_464860 [Massarina eburnea CBS 473.64]